MRKTKKSNKKRVSLGDIHMPYHDRRAVRFALEYIRATQPSGVDLLGDLQDCYSISSYDKNPSRLRSFKKELKVVREFLVDLRKVAPDADIRLLLGNHEDRLRKFLWRHAPELVGVKVAGTDTEAISFHHLLGLDELKIRSYPYGASYSIEGLTYLHGNKIRRGGGNTVRQHIQEGGYSVIMGHSHRLSSVALRLHNKIVRGYENGCLCTLNQEYLLGLPDWQQGFSVVDFAPTGKNLSKFSEKSFDVTQIWL